MTPKRISADRPGAPSAVPVRVVVVTLDHHLGATTDRAAARLHKDLPGLTLDLHAAARWEDDPSALERAKADVLCADIVIVTMLFMDDHIRAILPALAARREACDAMVCVMSAAEVTRLTRMGRLTMDKPASGPLALLKRLRGQNGAATAGAEQLKMLRRLPKILRFIPGTAQDLRAWFLTLQYWLAGSEENVANLVRLLVDRYADGPRKVLRGTVPAAEPVVYPEVGVYHPALKGRISEDAARLPRAPKSRGTVGVLVMRSYLLAGNTRHYDGVIAALEARGLSVIPAFSSGLDVRPAVEKFFMVNGRPAIDALVSLTGFSLVGGPAYNDAKAAEELLANLDVPYLAAHPVEFQSLDGWRESERGLSPVEATIMVAIPELDGATGPMTFGGRDGEAGDMGVDPERAAMLAARVDRLVSLRARPKAERKVATVIFNFPPNAGAVGSAAYLAVFPSLFNTLKALKKDGYTVELPESVDALRERILEGNAARFGAQANVAARIPADDHVRRERHLAEIEKVWGPAPGRQLSDGRSLFVLGAEFGNVFVGVQPAFGVEGDPMRLLFEKSFAPTHAFSAFYRYLREDFGADAVLHFGTHGALEFMPGKQVGLGAKCWPDRLIGDLPNLYLYAANNPSEGALAKRRAAATLVSYLTPSLEQAGLYRGLIDLKASIDRWRALEPDTSAAERETLATVIRAQAVGLDLAGADDGWEDAEAKVGRLAAQVLEVEYALIPHGLHVVGETPGEAELSETLAALGEAAGGEAPEGVAELLRTDHETPAILRALDGRFIRPAPAGDLIRSPGILPTGRNLHGFDPFRIPSAFAMKDGARQAARLIARHVADGNAFPESVALVLWGTDTLKTEGGPIAQALALMGARPRFDGYGRVAGATLVPLAELDTPRIDVVMTLSGIFRDLLPLQVRLLAEACWMAASADEPTDRNFVRKNALAYQARTGCDLETAALRVFSNAEGAYGANVNHLIENGLWSDEDDLAETYGRRKCFAYGVNGRPQAQPELLSAALSGVDLAYQNLESVETGVTTLDQYVDTLGGLTRLSKRARGSAPPVYIGDQTRGEGAVRTLSEQVALETRTRLLNPKWFEGMLAHGYEGVRHIEAHVTNTLGWSATTGQVDPWVYRQITDVYLLDPAMRERLARLNKTSASRVADRLIEAQDRNYWTPDDATRAALREAGEELEDRLEGVSGAPAAA
ncbi:magnesium chelatase subunit H [Chenggangzhangella methanolivorans]|uniref:magnesium chelatase n=1 Tax=Chenggangzhangella methanolivorans TaxID=1437009 RepID=A0A9E6UI56_9HYPH|nr:magnesium chelatase subunit H [Chenggangzhangella methanolivorans]QZO00468.1 magnesium chelatase subunit H [Chenggangzhangella methanolivorans]